MVARQWGTAGWQVGQQQQSFLWGGAAGNPSGPVAGAHHAYQVCNNKPRHGLGLTINWVRPGQWAGNCCLQGPLGMGKVQGAASSVTSQSAGSFSRVLLQCQACLGTEGSLCGKGSRHARPPPQQSGAQPVWSGLAAGVRSGTGPGPQLARTVAAMGWRLQRLGPVVSQ